MKKPRSVSSNRPAPPARRRVPLAVRFGSGAALAGLLLFAPASRPHRTLSSDAALLDAIEHRAFRYFYDQTDAKTGLTRDRAPADGSPSHAPASIAASGFALTAWCIGVERGWLDKDAATRRVLALLRSVDQSVPQEHGWIYHFIDIHSGARVWGSEASTIDTALFLQGALLAREYLNNPEVTTLVDRIYARIDWTWALNGGQTLSHGWEPGIGFLPYRWNTYSEMLGLYLLGIGAPVKPLPAECWNAWRREPVTVFGAYTYVDSRPCLPTNIPTHGSIFEEGMTGISTIGRTRWKRHWRNANGPKRWHPGSAAGPAICGA